MNSFEFCFVLMNHGQALYTPLKKQQFLKDWFNKNNFFLQEYALKSPSKKKPNDIYISRNKLFIILRTCSLLYGFLKEPFLLVSLW